MENPIILVVDNEPAMCAFLEHVLPLHGYYVLCASNGQEATDLFHNRVDHLDFVLTDMEMPRKNRLELIRELRTIKPELPVLLMSGNAQLGYDGLPEVPFIAKPFTIDELLLQLRKQLGDRKLLAE